MSDKEIKADAIVGRFRLDDSGSIIYARDIQSSGAIRKREGDKVRFKIDGRGTRGVYFRDNGKRFWISAGAVAFVIAYNSLPIYPGVVIIKPSDSNPDDYTEDNLEYSLMSDIKHKRSMRVRKCSGGFQSFFPQTKSLPVSPVATFTLSGSDRGREASYSVDDAVAMHRSSSNIAPDPPKVKRSVELSSTLPPTPSRSVPFR